MAITPYPAPDVILPNETGDIIDIKDFRPNMVVLFFYPRDNTSGCTREAKDFTENIELFNNLNICLLYTSPSPRDATLSRMPSSA